MCRSPIILLVCFLAPFCQVPLTCSVPVKVAVLGQIPASLLEVPKSEILTTPLYVLTKTLSPLMSLCVDAWRSWYWNNICSYLITTFTTGHISSQIITFDYTYFESSSYHQFRSVSVLRIWSLKTTLICELVQLWYLCTIFWSWRYLSPSSICFE